jgi:hypothetical protein
MSNSTREKPAVDIGDGYVIVDRTPHKRGPHVFELMNGHGLHSDEARASQADDRERWVSIAATRHPQIDRGRALEALQTLDFIASQERGQPDGEGAREGEDGDTRPWIPAANGDLPSASEAAWKALRKANDPVRLFRFGGQVAGLARDDEGTLRVRALDDHALRGELARGSRWYKETQEGRVIVLPPSHVVHDLLATPDVPLPVLRRVVEVPVAAPDGSLQLMPGYHPQTGVYYAPAQGLAIAAVPEIATAQDVVRASRLIRRDLLGDFPFVTRADRAHAICTLLEPFVRDMIDGPTPATMLASVPYAPCYYRWRI